MMGTFTFVVGLLLAEANPAALQIRAVEPGAELRLTLDAPGWSAACPSPVTRDSPCDLAAVPRPIVHLGVSGSRNFDAHLVLPPSAATVRLEHRGYGRTAGGFALVAGGVGLIALGVRSAEHGDASNGRLLISVGASIEAVGLVCIIADLTGRHDHAIVVP